MRKPHRVFRGFLSAETDFAGKSCPAHETQAASNDLDVYISAYCTAAEQTLLTLQYWVRPA